MLSPERLRERLLLSPGMTVLEIGVGGGYYARPLAALVRSFIALDLQAEMLKRLLHKAGEAHLLPVRASAGELPLATSSIDVVIAVTVIGELPSAPRAIDEIRRILRKGGMFSVSEHWPDPDFVPFARMRELCHQGGLQFEALHGGRFNYTATFRA